MVDELGTIDSIVRREYQLDTPARDIVEMSAERYWEYTKESIVRAVGESGVERRSIRSIGVSSQGETLIVVDRNGVPLRKAIVWLDNRSRRESAELKEAFGLIRETGQNEVLPTWPATRILWLRRHEPEVFERAHKYLLIEDYLIWKLTGEYVGELSLYTSSYLVDIVRRSWLPNVLDYVGITEDRLPILSEPGSEAGRLREELCDELALSKETRVITGAMDQSASVVGSGGVTDDVVVETTGTVLSVCRTLDAFDEHAHRGHPVHYHAARGKYHSIDWCPTGGKSLGWLRDLLTGEGAGAVGFDELIAPTNEVVPGSDGLQFYPFLSGLGTYGPVDSTHGAFVGIELHHERAHFVKSVLESVAFLIRRSLESGGSSTKVDEIRSLGGGAVSDTWNQMKADVTEKRIVTLENNESSTLGIAMMQAVAGGLYGSLSEAASAMIRLKRTYEPDRDRSARYREAYERYREMLESLYLR